MPHIDDDVLAMIALRSEEPDPETAAHLRDCARCREELAGLERVVRAGQARGAADPLTSPPDRVWDAIEAAVDDEETATSTEPPVPIAPRPERRQPRRVPTWLAVAAGVVIGVAGTGVVVTATQPDENGGSERQPIATADLAGLGDTGTPGTAQVYRSDGGRLLDVQLDSRTAGPGFREVWLLDADSGELVSLGVLNGTEATFSIPDGLDLGRFPTVDVSREPLNGDPTHSGDSIARGELDL